MWNELWIDLRFRLRTLRRHPTFAVVTLVTLALGIGACTALFSIVHGVLINPLPYSQSERLVAVFKASPEQDQLRLPTSPLYFLRWRDRSTHLKTVTAAVPWSPTLTGMERPDKLNGLRASVTLFDLLGAGPLLGSVFSSGHETAGPDRVVVLGHDLWRRKFGGEREVVGQTVTLDAEPYIVIGVMPPDFRFPPFWATEAEFWTPLVFQPETRQSNSNFLRVFARLKTGSTLEQARAEIEQLSTDLVRERRITGRELGVTVEPLMEPVVSEIRPALLILLGAGGLLLLIACANVANLQLARALFRDSEMAIRLAMGAGRWRLLRQMWTESLALFLLGGGLGVLTAWLLIELLPGLAPEDLPRLSEIRLDSTSLFFALGVALATGVLFGSIPALQATRPHLGRALRAGRIGSDSRSRGWASRLLVVSEVAMAMVLLAAAGLLIRSFDQLSRLDPGLALENRLTLTVGLTGSRFEGAQQSRFLEEALDRIRAVAGVRRAGAVNHLHLGGDLWASTVTVEGRETPESDKLSASIRTVDPGFFSAAGIPLLRGRGFENGDTAESTRVVVVNQKLAQLLWDGNAVGKRIRQSRRWPWTTVVGVVGDARQWDPTDDVRPEVYYPYPQNPVSFWSAISLVVHTSIPPRNTVGAIEEEIWAVDKNLPVTQIRTMEEIFAASISQQRFNATLLLVFSLVALTLSAVGLYGVLAHSVNQRRREIGIRMALGAVVADIVRLVVGQGLVLAGCGLVLGWGLALILARLLSSLLYGVTTADPWAFAGAAALLTLVALLACFRPARQAAAVDPLETLRYE